MMDVKKLIKDKNVHFMYYREGELWYKTDDGFEFPVPISDVGKGIMKDTGKEIYYMRWIRKHVQLIEDSKRMDKEILWDWLKKQTSFSYIKGTGELTIWKGKVFVLERTVIKGQSLEDCVLKAMEQESNGTINTEFDTLITEVEDE